MLGFERLHGFCPALHPTTGGVLWEALPYVEVPGADQSLLEHKEEGPAQSREKVSSKLKGSDLTSLADCKL